MRRANDSDGDHLWSRLTKQLHHVAAALDVSVHWLLTGERDPFEVQFAGYGCTYPFADAEEEEMMEDA